MARHKSTVHKEIIEAMDKVRGPLAASRRIHGIMSNGRIQRKVFKRSIPLMGKLCDSAEKLVPDKELATHAAWLYARKEGLKMPPDPSFETIERLLSENGKELPFDENVALVRRHGPVSKISENAQKTQEMIPEVERVVLKEGNTIDYDTLKGKGSKFNFLKKIYNALMIVSAPVILAGVIFASKPWYINPEYNIGNNPLYGLGVKIALSGVGLLAAMYIARESHGSRCGSGADAIRDALNNLKGNLRELDKRLETVKEKTSYNI
jgi:hypothetical protein